ncbi:MAG TPA: MgtC/SapB family protein [Chthoniobacterales bacterium]
MEPFITLGISLGLGLLIGLQRESSEARFGGIRTFPLISLFGTFCGMLGQAYGPWPIVAGIIAIFGTLVIANWLAEQREESEHGQTTEIAALLTFAIGAYLPSGDRALAAVATGLIVILLHLKEPMHIFVRKMGPKDMAGIMQLVVISLIILPLLPNRAFGPFNVLNPFDIWRMVVLIVGLNLTGYIIYKMVGSTASVALGGTLGGLISSTATTVSYARRAKEAPAAHMLAVAVIMIASAISYFRVIIEVSLFAPSNLGALLPPLVVASIGSAVIAVAAFLFFRGDREEMPPPANPAELKSALVFGILYAAVTFVVAAVKQYFDPAALYGVAIISGLTDMDAITLSVARMVENRHLESDNAWRLILAASLSNFVFKGVTATFLGGWRFGMRLAPFFGAALLGGLALIWFWPKQWVFISG